MSEEANHEHAIDSELVSQARLGDTASFGLLADRHAERLFKLAVVLLGNPADAEDVVQDTLIGAMGSIRGFKGNSTVKTWLTRILVNKVARFRRYWRLRRAIPIDQAPYEGDSSPGSDQRVLSEVRMDLATVLGRLPVDQRTIIVLRELQQMSYDEISEVLAIPRGTVESRLFRARQKLRELLSAYGPDPASATGAGASNEMR